MYAAIAKPSGSAKMPGAPFAMNGPPCVLGMQLPSGAVVRVTTPDYATAKPEEIRSGVFKKSRLAPEGGFLQIARMPAVCKLN